MDQQQPEQLAVSLATGAKMLSLGRDVMYRLVMAGEVPSWKVGARRLLPVAGLRAYVERQTAESSLAEADAAVSR